MHSVVVIQLFRMSVPEFRMYIDALLQFMLCVLKHIGGISATLQCN